MDEQGVAESTNSSVWGSPCPPAPGRAAALTCSAEAAQRRAQRGSQGAAAAEAQGGVGGLGRALREQRAALRVAAQGVVAVEGAGGQVVGGLLLGLGLGLLRAQGSEGAVGGPCQPSCCSVGRGRRRRHRCGTQKWGKIGKANENHRENQFSSRFWKLKLRRSL